MEELLAGLAPANLALAVEIASVPDRIRGYGPRQGAQRRGDRGGSAPPSSSAGGRAGPEAGRRGPRRLTGFTPRRSTAPMERKGKHLEFIQGTVNRLSTNSFLLKGWSVVLVSGPARPCVRPTSTSTSSTSPGSRPIAFWILDGYFLWQERLFRRLYDHVRSLDEHDIDFSMDTSPYVAETTPWAGVCWSKTLVIFHGAVLATVVIVTLLVLNLAG